MLDIISNRDKSILSQSEPGRTARLYFIGFTLVVLICLSASLPGGTSLRLTPEEYFHQPRYSAAMEIIESQEALVSQIIKERALQIWGENATKYFENSGLKPYSGLYQSDSVFIQRRTVWVSSLFARDIDFMEVSLYTRDGVYALRETYAINRNNKSWRVIDSAGFPFFERSLEITAETIDSDNEFRDFILTTLSYAGYGSYTVLETVDTVYHRIDLSESIGEKFMPFLSKSIGDTIEIQFTGSLNGGVDVTNWIIKYHPEGIVIEEYEQLISYESLPEIEPDEQLRSTDPLEKANLLTDVESEEDTALDSSMQAFSKNNIRLADLIKGNFPPPPAGHTTFEILSSYIADSSSSDTLTSEPQFIFFRQPPYPAKALKDNIEGEVEIQCLIDTTGQPVKPRLITTSDSAAAFDKSALAAVFLSEFRPGYVGETKVETYINYKVKFHLAARFPTESEEKNVDSTGVSTDTNSADIGVLDTAKVDSITDTTADTTKDTAADTASDTTSTPTLDTAIFDTTTIDTTANDSTILDTTSSDTARPDSAISDTTTIDTTANDTAANDTAKTDEPKPDTTTSDSPSTDSAKSG
ncbi:MAG: energy transducer TonB [candidate division Zixibacteria bacterium]|nr:energy transducer TonB [candidate division Zixibacteria bacterium]